MTISLVVIRCLHKHLKMYLLFKQIDVVSLLKTCGQEHSGGGWCWVAFGSQSRRSR